MTVHWAYGWALLLVPGAMWSQQPGQPTDASIRQLIERGQLDAAERAARVGGDTTAVILGDALVLRGRFAAADSAYQTAVARHLPAFRSALASMAELALRRGDRGDATRLA
ncbi:MAG: hypothetical protein ACRELE_12550, partial [Gemmatimonadales bacterium]